MRMRIGLLLAASLGALGACDRPESPAEEPVQARQDATRDACIARQLLARAEENLQALEEFGAGAEAAAGGPAGAVYEYARIYYHHADLRNAAYAHLDSAANHSRASADSLRHVRTAAGYATPVPEPGSLDANVIEAYSRDRAAILRDADHRCNWDF